MHQVRVRGGGARRLTHSWTWWGASGLDTELIDFIAEVLGQHTVMNRAVVDGRTVFECRCQWAGTAGLTFRRHVASQVMGAALTATAQVHAENVARVLHDSEAQLASRFTNRIEALMRLLIDTGDITPMGARQVRLVVADSFDLAGK